MRLRFFPLPSGLRSGHNHRQRDSKVTSRSLTEFGKVQTDDMGAYYFAAVSLNIHTFKQHLMQLAPSSFDGAEHDSDNCRKRQTT